MNKKELCETILLCEQVCLVCHILYTTFICFKPLQKSLLFSQKHSILDVFDRVLSTLLTFLFYVRNVYFRCPGAVARSCSVRKVFLEKSQNSQKIPFARVPFLIKLQAEAQVFLVFLSRCYCTGVSCEFCDISKNTFF